jgi:hypothetical protein
MDRWPPTPLEDPDVALCTACRHELPDATYFSESGGGHFCEKCARAIYAATLEQAAKFALANVRVTSEPEPFDSDPELEIKPSPQEYAAGAKLAYTRNAWRAHVRHACTNYDELTSGLAKDDPLHRVRYDAIRQRVEELIEDYV